MILRQVLACCGVLTLLLTGSPRVGFGAAAPSSDWPQWRGPNRDGVTPERSGWPNGWPPKRLWARNLGRGSSSPIVVGDRVVVMGWQGRGNLRRNPLGADTIYCLDARTGRQVWRQTYPCRYQPRTRAGDLGQYGGPHSTPTWDRETGLLYTLSSDGHLQCWDTRREGKRVWSINLFDTYKVRRRPDVGGGRRDFGFTGSPLLLGDRVVVEVGGDQGTVMAFDKKTGVRRWASRHRGAGGHTSGPVAMTVDGISCLANLTLTGLVVMRLDAGREGETVAEYKWQTHYGCNLPTPAVAGRRVLLTSAYNRKRTELIEVSLKGARRVWTSRSNALLSTPVIHGDRAYLIFGPVMCLDLATGRRRWRGGSFYHGSCLVTGDDKLLVFGKGRLALIEARAGQGEYRELGHVDWVVRDVCYPQVALANGFIVCKDKGGNMVCFAVKK